jgi:large subunit ribosomal protein L13
VADISATVALGPHSAPGDAKNLVIDPMSTTLSKPSTISHDWYVIDASDAIVGRLATRVATVLRGKHKPTFTPHLDGGDFVIIVNAEKVRFTGKKLDQKHYHRFTGYMGHLKSTSARDMLAKHPERVLQEAIKSMLPKNKLSRDVFRKLKVYAGPDHPHQAQQPKPFPEMV